MATSVPLAPVGRWPGWRTLLLVAAITFLLLLGFALIPRLITW
ncbi:MAG: hypothetical protein ACYDCK_02135 [Thermoplasmatota archaeon]